MSLPQLKQFRFWLFFVLLLAAGPLCLAQTSPVTLRGRVLDPNRAAVRGAKITLTSDARQNRKSTVSDDNGDFSVVIEPGNYSLEVAATGFAETRIPLEAKNTDGELLEILLDISASSATVTVTDGGGYQISAFSSATKTLTNLRDIPQSISFVTRDQIQDRSLDSLA